MGIIEYLFEYYENIKIKYFTPTKNIGLEVLTESFDALLRKLLPLDITINPFYTLKSLTDNKIIFKKNYTDQELKVNNFDNLICLGDIRSDDSLFWQMQDKVGKVYRLGDAQAPNCVELAIHGAEKLARSV